MSQPDSPSDGLSTFSEAVSAISLAENTFRAAATSEKSLIRLVIAIRRAMSRRRFVASIQVIDFLAFFSLARLYFDMLIPGTFRHRWLYGALSLLAASIIHCIFQCFRLYDFDTMMKGGTSALRAFAAGSMLLCLLLLPLLTESQMWLEEAVTTYWPVAAIVSGIGLLRVLTAYLAAVLQDTGVIRRRIYIISDSAQATLTLRTALERWSGNRVVGTWQMKDSEQSADAALEGAVRFISGNPVDTVILQMSLSQPDRLRNVARVLRNLPRKVLLSPNLAGGGEIVLHHGAPSDLLEDMGMVRLSDRPLTGWRWVVKDLQDRLIALLLLIIVFPVMLAIMIAIKLSDPGPVFFRQQRRGYFGEKFEIIKFRSMRVSGARANPHGLILTTRDDPRVFPVGRILRKTSLDELPQLFNVLKGDMWIVGPRPHSPHARANGQIYVDAVQGYLARYRIKPGITGWAQVCGWRGPTDTLEQLSKRVEHDLYYIENWSPLFDASILFKTLSCVLGQKNAF